MSDPEKLGGFKVLKETAFLSAGPFEIDGRLPVAPFRVLAEHEVNLPYATCIRGNSEEWRMNMVVDFKDEQTARRLLAKILGENPDRRSGAAVLSIFPHRKKPAITGALIEAFRREGIYPGAIAHSPSAISTVLDENDLLKASSSLFGPFAFGAYRTPADWKLAQDGKEKLYKEVVASYQEKRPKVYGLEYQDHQELLHITLAPSRFKALSPAFENVSLSGLELTFLIANRSRDTSAFLDICLPLTKRGSNRDTLARILKPLNIETVAPVGTFSMNGPHFGDRYGIVRDLFTALETAGIDLWGLSCTIASITGVVPSSQLTRAVGAIQNCFDVPAIIKRDRQYD